MGTQGMKASLVSREVIADSIELVARGNLFDGLVGIGGCDKNMPGIIMALCRLDIPGLMLYGGSIAPGKLQRPERRDRSTSPSRTSSKASAPTPPARSTTPARSPRSRRLSRRRRLRRPVHRQHHGHGGEFLGISPMQLSGVPGDATEKAAAAARPAAWSWIWLRHDLRPRKIITRDRWRTLSPRSPPRRLDQRRSAPDRHRQRGGLDLTVDDFDRITDKTPLICDLMPGGKYIARITRPPAVRACWPSG